jgi:hypothetical protein
MCNVEDEAMRRQRANPTQQPTRLCRIGKIATRIYRVINEWESQINKRLPEPLCDSVEDLIDAYRYMVRIDSSHTLKEIRKLHNQWVSMRKLVKAYKIIALCFDSLARGKINQLHRASTLAPRGSQEQTKLNAKVKKKLDTMAKRYWHFVTVTQDLYNRAPGLMQYGLKDTIKAMLDERVIILERMHLCSWCAASWNCGDYGK